MISHDPVTRVMFAFNGPMAERKERQGLKMQKRKERSLNISQGRCGRPNTAIHVNGCSKSITTRQPESGLKQVGHYVQALRRRTPSLLVQSHLVRHDLIAASCGNYKRSNPGVNLNPSTLLTPIRKANSMDRLNICEPRYDPDRNLQARELILHQK